MGMILILLMGTLLIAYMLWCDQREEIQKKELEDTIDRLQSDVFKLYCENLNMRQAIVSHCMLTESVTPDIDAPFDTINNVIKWHIETQQDWPTPDVGCTNIDIGGEDEYA